MNHLLFIKFFLKYNYMKQTSKEPVTCRTDINPIFPTKTFKKITTRFLARQLFAFYTIKNNLQASTVKSKG